MTVPSRCLNGFGSPCSCSCPSSTRPPATCRPCRSAAQARVDVAAHRTGGEPLFVAVCDLGALGRRRPPGAALIYPLLSAVVRAVRLTSARRPTPTSKNTTRVLQPWRPRRQDTTNLVIVCERHQTRTASPRDREAPRGPYARPGPRSAAGSLRRWPAAPDDRRSDRPPVAEAAPLLVRTDIRRTGSSPGIDKAVQWEDCLVWMCDTRDWPSGV
jgi:hypothetical protein